MELQEVVDEEGRLESTHSLVGLLCGLAAQRANDKVFASLDLHREVGKAVSCCLRLARASLTACSAAIV